MKKLGQTGRRTDGQTDKQTDRPTYGNGWLFLRIVGIMTGWENVEVEIRPNIATLPTESRGAPFRGGNKTSLYRAFFSQKFELLAKKHNANSYTTNRCNTLHWDNVINNRASSFGDYVSNKTVYRQTDRQSDRETETGNNFFRIVGFMKRRENIKVAIFLVDSITIFA